MHHRFFLHIVYIYIYVYIYKRCIIGLDECFLPLTHLPSIPNCPSISAAFGLQETAVSSQSLGSWWGESRLSVVMVIIPIVAVVLYSMNLICINLLESIYYGMMININHCYTYFADADANDRCCFGRVIPCVMPMHLRDAGMPGVAS